MGRYFGWIGFHFESSVTQNAETPEAEPVIEKGEEPADTAEQIVSPPQPDEDTAAAEPKPEPAPAPEPEPEPVITDTGRELDVNAGSYFVQAGAFPNEAMALERKKLIDAQFSFKTGIILENNLYKLRLGYFAKKADAEDCYKVLISNGFEAFFGIVERN